MKQERWTMNETTQARTPKAARATASAAEDVAATTLRPELPSSFIDLFEKSIARAKDTHEKVTSIVEHSAEAFEEAFSCASRGSAEYRGKLMEIARANANSAFDLGREVFEAKSVPQLMEATLAYQRRQMEAAAAQMKELSALTQRSSARQRSRSAAG